MFHDHRITLRTSLLAIGTVALVALVTSSVWRIADSAEAAPAPSEQRLLTFTGTGTAQIAPDSATISAGVSATGRSADEAQDSASRQMTRLLAHMKAAGVASKDLQTSEASVSEDWDRKGLFRASQSLTISLDDPDRAGKLLGEATSGGADSVSGPSFGLEDQRAGYDEALRTAIADARAKADAAASHMGATVKTVYSIGETGGIDGGVMMARDSSAPVAELATTVPVEQGTQTVAMTVDVSFTYER